MDHLLDNQFNQKTEYAGFGIRFGAQLLDGLITFPLGVLVIYNNLDWKNFGLACIVILISAVYKPLMEYKFGQTLGKMIVNIKVVDYDGNRLNGTQALYRYLPWMLSIAISIYTVYALYSNEDFMNTEDFFELSLLQTQIVPSYLSYIGSLAILISVVAIFNNPKKQALHDKFAMTYVVKVKQ